MALFKLNIDTESLIGYRIKLYPTEEQKVILNRNIELYRWVYNWALETIQKRYTETGEFTRDFALYYIFQDLRKSEEYSWLREFPLATAKNAIQCAVKAYINFFEKRCNFPKFKSRRRSSLSFGVRGCRVYLKENGYVGIEGLGKGLAARIYYCKSSIPEDVQYPLKLYSVRITFDKDDYWLSFQIEQSRSYDLGEKTDIIGIDVGVKHLATLSDGTVYNSPDVHVLKEDTKSYAEKQESIIEKC